METDPLAVLRDQLGDDVCALLHRGDVAVTEIHLLVAPDAPDRAARAVRVRYADGEARKGVRCIHARRAARVAAISRRLDPAVFSPVLAQRGAALLMPWIEGVSLDAAGWDADDVASAGRLLAHLHRVPIPADAGASDASVSAYDRLLSSNLKILADRAEISAEEHQALLTLAQAHSPDSLSLAVIHRDLCPENLVRQPSATLQVIDVESLAVGDRDYDLARTWYRWPMSGEQRRAFFDAYVDGGGAQPNWACFPYWAICAIASSAAQRRLRGDDGYDIPLRRLRALRATLDGGAGGRQIAIES